jgi:steroid 5-alpha reductase family enzyme
VMESKGWSWPKTALIMVFAMQAPLLFITCLPAQVGIITSGDSIGIGTIAWIGILVALAGIAFETIGDAQLKSFKSNPENKGKVLDTGLWRYTRHPNYFGDFLTWWGIWLVAADAGIMFALITMIGPLFLSFTLMKWSGGPMLERGMKKTRPDYDDYKRRTSSFFPMPPKKL